MRKRKRQNRRFTLTVPAIRKMRESMDHGALGDWLVKQGESSGAGSVHVRYTLKDKPWILTVKAERNYHFKGRQRNII